MKWSIFSLKWATQELVLKACLYAISQLILSSISIYWHVWSRRPQKSHHFLYLGRALKEHRQEITMTCIRLFYKSSSRTSPLSKQLNCVLSLADRMRESVLLMRSWKMIKLISRSFTCQIIRNFLSQKSLLRSSANS